jgi:hypothetical protein
MCQKNNDKILYKIIKKLKGWKIVEKYFPH